MQTIDLTKIERFKHTLHIQKLSSTTFTEDCKDLRGKELPSHFGFNNGNPNVWRAKAGRSGKWIYSNDLLHLLHLVNEQIEL